MPVAPASATVRLGGGTVAGKWANIRRHTSHLLLQLPCLAQLLEASRTFTLNATVRIPPTAVLIRPVSTAYS
jgi:hypothetical protein